MKTIDDLKKDGYEIGSFAETRYLGCDQILGCAILIKTPDPLDEEDKEWIKDCMYEIRSKLNKSKNRKNPELPKKHAKIKADLIEAFKIAGFDVVYVKEIPNQYWPEEKCAEPWLKVTTSIGPITVGWRKRVINIDWSESDLKVDPQDLFPNENVTTGTTEEKYIHAWGYEKLTEYLKTLHSVA